MQVGSPRLRQCRRFADDSTGVETLHRRPLCYQSLHCVGPPQCPMMTTAGRQSTRPAIPLGESGASLDSFSCARTRERVRGVDAIPEAEHPVPGGELQVHLSNGDRPVPRRLPDAVPLPGNGGSLWQISRRVLVLRSEVGRRCVQQPGRVPDSYIQRVDPAVLISTCRPQQVRLCEQRVGQLMRALMRATYPCTCPSPVRMSSGNLLVTPAHSAFTPPLAASPRAPWMPSRGWPA